MNGYDNLFPQLKKRHQVFHLVSDENPSVMFSDHISVHVLCLSGVRIGREEKIRDWNDALQGWSLFLSCEPEDLEEQMSVISKKNPVLSDVGKEFRRYASDNEMRELERSRMRYAAMVRIETGAAFELGEARGKAEGRTEIARKLRMEGFSSDAISRLTGLSENEIAQLD